MSNASSKVRTLFQESEGTPLTLMLIKSKLQDLKASEISMALCYLMRQRYLTRQKVANQQTKGRKEVWSYTYHAERIAKPTEQENTNEQAAA